MSETILTSARTTVEARRADITEIETYWAEAKANLKTAKRTLKDVERAVNFYAPQVVAGVKWLNQNARGWARQIEENGFIDLPEGTSLVDLGLEGSDKFPDLEDAVLGDLWQTALKIHRQKKTVTLPRLLKKVGT